MEQNEFYSVALKKKIKIPSANIKKVTRKGRNFLVGTYTANNKRYEAWKVIKG
jgi:hypothetical protein